MIGTRLGPYEITAKLGEGGMGVVFKARDSHLRREVALKVLPAGFTADPERASRFEREARLLASLNHPNIAQLYGLEMSGVTRALVMELVGGPTLAERLESGPLLLDEVLSIARQIAQALEEAHEKGIIHRDLKPQNVKASKEGTVKVLDFGLAKALDPSPSAASAADLANSPTATSGGTREGVILGTAGYMSPEQARGAAVDKRADIWAFGVVLYEMLTGERLFAEATVVDTLSAVMRKEIDLERLPRSTPPRLRELVRRCLERNPRNRLHAIADARIVLAELEEEGPAAWGTAGPDLPRKSTLSYRQWTVPAVGGILVGVLISALWLARDGSQATGSGTVATGSGVRFQFLPPPGHEFPGNVESVYLAVSPDGSTLAFVASEPSVPARIWLRRVDDLVARPLAGTEGARSLTWSPDGRSIAFFAGDKLKRLELAGGAAVPLCDAPPGTGLAASWGAAGDILFATVQGDAIYRVSSSGGVAEKIVEPDASQGEFRVAWPYFLPDGRGFLYLLGTSTGDSRSRLMQFEPGSTPRAVAPLTSRVELVAPDLLVFASDGALLGQRFDRAAGRLVDAPVSIAPAVRYFYSSNWAGFATSPGGTIFLLTEPGSSRLVWFDRTGRRGAAVGPEGVYQYVSLAPDGRTLLAGRTQPRHGTHDLWQIDLERGVETRLTSAPEADFAGIALPGGSAIVYSSSRGQAPDLVRRDLVSGAEEPLLPNPVFRYATDVTRDGRLLAFVERGGTGKFQAWTLRLEGEPRPERLFASDSAQLQMRFSPDGNFVAYVSDESGNYEAYLSPLASPAEKIRLSPQGATQLRWSRDGREIFLLTPARELLAVPLRTGPPLEIGTPSALFSLPPGTVWFEFDVAPDGQRFLANVRERSAGAEPATAILGWSPSLAQ